MPRRKKQSSEAAVRDIRRKTRRRFSAEEKIRIVLDGMRGELSVALDHTQTVISNRGCCRGISVVVREAIRV